MSNTLLLDRTAWDLVLDNGGNIAMASDTYSIAQDVASACRLFLGELWYNTNEGIPYFQKVLGKMPPVSLLTAQLEKAALTVPHVTAAQCVITSVSNRTVSGTVAFKTDTGATGSATL